MMEFSIKPPASMHCGRTPRSRISKLDVAATAAAFDSYRVERTSLRTGVAPAAAPRLSRLTITSK
jgi:hypothetical protein